MREFITVAGAVIPLIGVVPYLLDTAKKKTRPNLVTWFTWSLINYINAAAAFSDGAWQTGVFSLVGAIATTAILVVGLRSGVKKYTPLDILCQVAALLGIPLWLTTGQPELAVFILVCVDFAGGLPTLRHAWKAPHEETWLTFAASWLGALLVVASLSRYDIVSLAMPLYILLFETAVITTLYLRGRAVKQGNEK